MERRSTAEFVNVSQVKRGQFNLQKVPRLALEIMLVETIGNAFQITLRDIHGDKIMASFHPDCRDVVVRQVRPGRIILLKDAAIF